MDLIDRSDQVWEYRDAHERFTIAYVHAPKDEGGHFVTVIFSSDERIWAVGAARWAEGWGDAWEECPGFTRLI